MIARRYALALLASAALATACGGASSPAASPGSSADAQFVAECTSPGHPPWRGDTHETRDLVDDDVRLHVAKYPGHAVRITTVSH